MQVPVEVALGEVIGIEQVEAQLVAVQLVGNLEHHLEVVHEQFVAAFGDDRIQVTNRHQVAQAQVLTLVGQ